jgi:5-formaminoimidazole-4-carboxamide-1-beta-D-ribofuranosyl 5'-monophosphate synthetase
LFDLLPEDQRMPGQVDGIKIGIRFQFSSGNAPTTTLQANVSVVHTERLAQDKYHVGVQFINLDKATARMLEDYVEECRDTSQD